MLDYIIADLKLLMIEKLLTVLLLNLWVAHLEINMIVIIIVC